MDYLTLSLIVFQKKKYLTFQTNDKSGKRKLVTYFTDSGREVTPIACQTYEKAFFRGNIIACKSPIIYKTNSLTGDTVRFHIIPQERAIDIDNEIDFQICENLINYQNKKLNL